MQDNTLSRLLQGNIFQEEYDIYDSVECDTIGCDYAIEKKDALENLKEN